MKTKALLPFQELWAFAQNKPEKAALIAAAIIVIPMATLLTLFLPDKSLFNLIFAPIIVLFGVGGTFWFGFAMTFGEKKSRELSERALKSELEVMINQSLIENGSITKPEQMVRL